MAAEFGSFGALFHLACIIGTHCRGLRQASQSAMVLLSASPVGLIRFNRSTSAKIRGKNGLSSMLCFPPTGRKTRQARCARNVSTARNHQPFRTQECWEARERSKTGAQSLREGLLRPLGRSHCAWLTCWCSSSRASIARVAIHLPPPFTMALKIACKTRCSARLNTPR